jgi:hypothetical protein
MLREPPDWCGAADLPPSPIPNPIPIENGDGAGLVAVVVAALVFTCRVLVLTLPRRVCGVLVLP